MSILSFFNPLSKPSSIDRKEATQPKISGGSVHESVSLSANSVPESINIVNKPYAAKISCPKYKKIPITPFTIDAFRYGLIPDCTGYFLSHFHSDHFAGLTRKFQGTIYCSEITGQLLLRQFGSNLHIVTLPMDIFVNVQGFDVMFLDANHCPGSVMILFRLIEQKKVILHTGDFRASSLMFEYPSILLDYMPSASSSTQISSIYLDTTYCSPEYEFPTQESAISAAIAVTREYLRGAPDTLVFCGMYSIGKERFVLGLSESLNLTVWLPPKQLRLITAAANGGCKICELLLSRSVTSNKDAQLFVADMAQLSTRILPTLLPPVQRVRVPPILAWRPTGWTHKQGRMFSAATLEKNPCKDIMLKFSSCVSVISISKSVTIFGAAYSEHSSYSELKNFISTLRPAFVQPTVFGGAAKNAKSHISSWLST